MTTVNNILASVLFAAIALIVGSFAFVPTARAADLPGSGDVYYYPDTSYTYYPDYSYSYYPDYSYSTPLSSYPSYSYPSYNDSTPSYISPPSYYTPPSYLTPSYQISSATAVSSVYAPTSYWNNTETCNTFNSCNDNSDHSVYSPWNYLDTSDHSVYSPWNYLDTSDHRSWTDNRSSWQYTDTSDRSVYAPSNTETCNAFNSCNDNSSYHYSYSYVDNTDNSYSYTDNSRVTYNYNTASYQPPVHHPPVHYTPPPTYYPSYQPRQPYVSLSAIPYTGLELGPVGTTLYWLFLVLVSLFAAYLVVVKRVQVKLYHALNRMLFGEGNTPAPAIAGAPDLSQTDLARIASFLRTSASVYPEQSRVTSADSTDEFIRSQIYRVRAR